MFAETTIHPDSFLARLCRQELLVNTAGKEPLRQIPFLRWDGSSGRKASSNASKGSALRAFHRGRFRDARHRHWSLRNAGARCLVRERASVFRRAYSRMYEDWSIAAEEWHYERGRNIFDGKERRNEFKISFQTFQA